MSNTRPEFINEIQVVLVFSCLQRKAFVLQLIGPDITLYADPTHINQKHNNNFLCSCEGSRIISFHLY